MRTCTKCGATSALSNFYISRGRPRAICKPCGRAETRAWARANKGRKAATAKAYVEKNKESVSAKGKEYRAKADKERVAAYNKQYRKENIERVMRLSKAWREANPDRMRLLANRRAKRLRTAPGGRFYPTRPDYLLRVQEYGGLCAYCLKAPYTELDHAIPLSRGGTNHMYNVFPACRPCNAQKYNKILWDEWEPPKDRDQTRAQVAV